MRMSEDYTMNASLQGTSLGLIICRAEKILSRITMMMMIGNVLVFKCNTRRFTRRSK
jgi:hypothetical protein